MSKKQTMSSNPILQLRLLTRYVEALSQRVDTLQEQLESTQELLDATQKRLQRIATHPKKTREVLERLMERLDALGDESSLDTE